MIKSVMLFLNTAVSQGMSKFCKVGGEFHFVSQTA